MRDNYQIQAQQAKDAFLRFGQQDLIRKCALRADGEYLYTALFGIPYHIGRKSGDLSCLEDGAWRDGNSHGEVITALDCLCGSWEDRRPAGRWKNMQDFGLQFHRNLAESPRNPVALRYQENPAGLRRALEALRMAGQFWLGDDEFPPSLRYLWDENALMYLRYETMYYAVNVLTEKIRRQMENARREE